MFRLRVIEDLKLPRGSESQFDSGYTHRSI